MNKAVLASKTLFEAIGSEWKHKKNTSSVTRILEVNGRDLSVTIGPVLGLKDSWNVLEFLREFSPVPPLDQVPSWYDRLREDNLLV